MAEPWRIEPGDLDKVVVETEAGTGEVYLQGAHVTSWAPSGQRPVLFLSSRSAFAAGKPIRGGVPIVFPWFGPRSDGKPGPAHGYARTTLWEFKSAVLAEESSVALEFRMAREAFDIRFDVTIGAELEMTLTVTNNSDDKRIFEEALHTYLAVGDARQATVSGLAGTTYIDKTDGFARKVLGTDPLRIAKETDWVFLDTEAVCTVHDPVWNRAISVEKAGSRTTVVWNPWIEKAATLNDLGPNEWQGMICVESANAGENAVHIEPGETHRLAVRIACK